MLYENAVNNKLLFQCSQRFSFPPLEFSLLPRCEFSFPCVHNLQRCISLERLSVIVNSVNNCVSSFIYVFAKACHAAFRGMAASIRSHSKTTRERCSVQFPARRNNSFPDRRLDGKRGEACAA